MARYPDDANTAGVMPTEGMPLPARRTAMDEPMTLADAWHSYTADRSDGKYASEEFFRAFEAGWLAALRGRGEEVPDECAKAPDGTLRVEINPRHLSPADIEAGWTVVPVLIREAPADE